MCSQANSSFPPAGGQSFPSTHWSVVLAAGDSAAPDAQEALEQLCRKYWYPLYAYVRRQGHPPEDAQDLTQAFFAQFLEKKYFGLADPQRGRFRSFLLASLRHFLHDQWDRATTARRGGGRKIVSFKLEQAEDRYRSEPTDDLTPEKAYERRWAADLLKEVLTKLRQEYAAAGKSCQFEVLQRFLWGADTLVSYSDVTDQLNLTSEAVKTAVYRLRSRCRQVLRNEIAQTVTSPEELEDEVRWLFSVFA